MPPDEPIQEYHTPHDILTMAYSFYVRSDKTAIPDYETLCRQPRDYYLDIFQMDDRLEYEKKMLEWLHDTRQTIERYGLKDKL